MKLLKWDCFLLLLFSSYVMTAKLALNLGDFFHPCFKMRVVFAWNPEADFYIVYLIKSVSLIPVVVAWGIPYCYSTLSILKALYWDRSWQQPPPTRPPHVDPEHIVWTVRCSLRGWVSKGYQHWLSQTVSIQFLNSFLFMHSVFAMISFSRPLSSFN